MQCVCYNTAYDNRWQKLVYIIIYIIICIYIDAYTYVHVYIYICPHGGDGEETGQISKIPIADVIFVNCIARRKHRIFKTKPITYNWRALFQDAKIAIPKKVGLQCQVYRFYLLKELFI